jgi:hypothetical protein
VLFNERLPALNELLYPVTALHPHVLKLKEAPMRQAASDKPFSRLFRQPDPEIRPFIRKFCGF